MMWEGPRYGQSSRAVEAGASSVLFCDRLQGLRVRSRRCGGDALYRRAALGDWSSREWSRLLWWGSQRRLGVVNVRLVLGIVVAALDILIVLELIIALMVLLGCLSALFVLARIDRLRVTSWRRHCSSRLRSRRLRATVKRRMRSTVMAVNDGRRRRSVMQLLSDRVLDGTLGRGVCERDASRWSPALCRSRRAVAVLGGG